MRRAAELGQLEQMVLLAVWRLEGDVAYALAVRDEIQQRTRRRLSVSTAYLTLIRLEGKGALASSLAAPTAVRGGKAKRCFRITPRGVAALRNARGEIDRLWDGLEPEAGRPSD